MCHPLQRVLLPAVLSLTCCPLPHLPPSPEAHHRELHPHRFIFSFMDPCEYYAAHPPDSSQQPPLPFPSPTPTISFSSSLSSSLHQDSSGQEHRGTRKFPQTSLRFHCPFPFPSPFFEMEFRRESRACHGSTVSIDKSVRRHVDACIG